MQGPSGTIGLDWPAPARKLYNQGSDANLDDPSAGGEKTMPLLSIVFGIILIPIGLVVFQITLEQTGRMAPTAFIPVGLGGLLLVLGALSYIQSFRKHAMHTAAMVALIGMLGAGYRAIPGLV